MRFRKGLTMHHLLHYLLVVDHDVGFLAMHPTLRVLVSVPKDRDLVIKHGKLDMAVSLLLDGVQRADLIFPGIPVDLEVSLLLLRTQLVI